MVLIVEDHAEHPPLPRRQPGRRRLRADRGRDRRGRPPADGDALPGPGDRRPRAARSGRPRAAAAVRGSDRAAGQLDPDLPLLVLTGRSGELDRLRAFDRGADDYLCKPFSYQELRARVDALLRRTRRRPGMGRLRVGPLSSIRCRARCGCAACRSSSRIRSSRCCARCRVSRRECSRARSCCAVSGASGRWGRRGLWTRTRSGCAASSTATATAS